MPHGVTELSYAYRKPLHLFGNLEAIKLLKILAAFPNVVKPIEVNRDEICLLRIHVYNLPSTEEFNSITYKSDPASNKSKEIPPYNGFGSEEDSLCNCLNLIPKPPRRDFIKFMEKDRLVCFVQSEL